MIAAIWIVAALLIGLWSLASWGLYRLLVSDTRWVGDLEVLIDRIPFGRWLDLWFPGWQEMVLTAIELTQHAFAWLGGAAPWVVGVVWAAGALVVLGTAALLALIVALIRRSSGGATPPAARA